jgi:hypothetical protein
MLAELAPELVIVRFVRLTSERGEVIRLAEAAVTPELPVKVFTVIEVEVKFTIPDVGVVVAVWVEVAVKVCVIVAVDVLVEVKVSVGVKVGC